MTITDMDLCPHGRRGPYSRRVCGCRLLEIPFSEVAMHIKVAGVFMWVQPVEFNADFDAIAVQLWNLSNKKYSSPILASEAGYRN